MQLVFMVAGWLAGWLRDPLLPLLPTRVSAYPFVCPHPCKNTSTPCNISHATLHSHSNATPPTRALSPGALRAAAGALCPPCNAVPPTPSPCPNSPSSLQVLFAQQLVLFAPHAVPPRKHTPLLLSTLASKRPALRRAAAATLRHLAERDPTAVLEEQVGTICCLLLPWEVVDGPYKCVPGVAVVMQFGVPLV